VLFESALRVNTTLADLLQAGVSPTRRVVVARELTKMHQEVIRGTVQSMADQLRGRRLRGEVVVVLEGGREREPRTLAEATAMAEGLEAEGVRRREAAKRA